MTSREKFATRVDLCYTAYEKGVHRMAISFVFLIAILFVFVVLIAVGFLLVALIRGGTARKQSNAFVSIRAKVVAKPADGSVLFQTESGERYEFRVKPDDFAAVHENDVGTLSFCGAKFERFSK